MTNDKKADNGASGNSRKKAGKAIKKGGRPQGGRHDRYVDSFRWGFVDGEDDFETNRNSDKPNFGSSKGDGKSDGRESKDSTGVSRIAKAEKIKDNDKRSKKGGRRDSASRSGGGSSADKVPTVGRETTRDSKQSAKRPKKVVPTLPVFDDEDDDDLNLPSYGRTPVPTDDELPQPISRKKALEPKRGESITAKSNDQDKATKKAVTGTPERQSSERRRPERRQEARPVESSDFATEYPDHRSSRMKREQMVWDPDKREYVPLIVHESTAKSVVEGGRRNREHSPGNNKIEERKSGAKNYSVVPDTALSKERSVRKQRAETSPKTPAKNETRSDDNGRRVDHQGHDRTETISVGGSSSGGHGSESNVRPKIKKTGRDVVDGKQSKSSKVSSDKPKTEREEKQPKPRREREERLQGEHSNDVEAKAVTAKDAGQTNRRPGKSFDRSSAEISGQKRDRRRMQRADVPPMDHQENLDPADIESEASGFAKLGVSETMLEALKIIRFLEPTPIQAGVFQQVKAGVDVMGQAQTGTGKTAAFSIPIIEGIEECPPGDAPVALILVPTRELAVQVRDEAAKLAYGRDVKLVACYGGKPIAKQIARLKDGVDILVGTPGRILDLMNRRALSLESLRWVVLDEADRMLDIGFRPDIEKILKRTPQDRQTLLFSATLAPPVVKLAERYMKSPEILDFSNKNIAVDTIEQFYITVDQQRKFDALVYLLDEQQPQQAIIFTRTKRGADRLARLLSKRFDSLAAIHGDLSQNDRDRVMGKFRAGNLRYLVATDVVGRGIDVSGISHIINYDIPAFCDDYVHRVGRTGRMGREGVAYTFVTVEEGAELTRIEMRIDKLLRRAELKGFEAFAKPVDNTSDDNDDGSSEPSKPVYGKPTRKIRRAL